MRTTPAFLPLAAYLAWLPLAGAQPLAKPLAQFDKMAAELKTSSVVGEPIRVGNTTVIPFAAVQFSLGSAGAVVGAAGGMGLKTVPLGVVIVEGGQVRLESLPHQEQKSPTAMQQVLQGIIDRKLLFMVNGINLGNAAGNVSDLTPMINAMMGQTTVMVQALNLGNLKPPLPPAADAQKTIAALETNANQNPAAEAYFKLAEALRKAGQKEKAAAAYQNAIELRPNYPEAARALAELKK
jgi:uncharacterized spore protein YtfJ